MSRSAVCLAAPRARSPITLAAGDVVGGMAWASCGGVRTDRHDGAEVAVTAAMLARGGVLAATVAPTGTWQRGRRQGRLQRVRRRMSRRAKMRQI
jgi:hypothetical protein